MVDAVRSRYLHNNKLREAEVFERLASFYMSKADPAKDGSYRGTERRYFEDLVYYHTRALQVDAVKSILGSLAFIERRAMRGSAQVERLLRDYIQTQEEFRGLKLSLLKGILSKDDLSKFSRAAVLSWLQEVGGPRGATSQSCLHRPHSSPPPPPSSLPHRGSTKCSSRRTSPRWLATLHSPSSLR